MTASMFQGEGGYMSAVGEKMKTHLPGPVALKQGSVGQTMSDLQFELDNERKQHEQGYINQRGAHASDNVPLGKASF